MNARTLDRVWIFLLAATATTWALGERGLAGPFAAAALIGIAGVKGWLVIGDFMALKHARFLWRAIVTGWLLLVLTTIAIAYHSGMQP